MRKKIVLTFLDLLDTSEIYMSESVLFTFLHDERLKYQVPCSIVKCNMQI